MDGPMGLDRAARFLRGRYGQGVTDVAELGGGDWSRAFSFRRDDRRLVARFGRHAEDYEKDRVAAAAFARPGLPVPAVLEVGEAAPGLFFAVSERRSGVFLEALDERGWRTLLPALLGALDALRAVEPPGRGIDWAAGEGAVAAPSWRDWLTASLEDRPGGRVSGWRARLHRAPDAEAAFRGGERELRSRLGACPEGRHVVHRDLLNRNVLVAPDASRLEAVFDWGCSVAGDFLYEVAWLTFWAPWHPALAAVDVRRAAQEHYRAIGLAVEHFDQRLACYELHIGLEHLAYCAFTAREDDLRAVARRTREVLEACRADRTGPGLRAQKPAMYGRGRAALLPGKEGTRGTV